MTLSFAYPWMLLFLWLVPVVGFWWYAAARRRARNLAMFVAPDMQRRLQPGRSFNRTIWQSVLLSLGLLLMLVAASRPRWGTREEMVFRRGRDLVIALDVSRSMLASDVYPNRLERAKVDLIDLISEFTGDRAALIAFRHKAVLLCPLTTDYSYLRQTLDNVAVDSAPRGETDIGDAIAKALAAFETRDSSHKAIVLVSDGEDLTGRAIALAEQAAERGIPIFTVGLGDQQGARIPDAEQPGAFAKHQGTDIVTKLDNETLDRIARISGGAYVPLGTASTATTTLGELYRKRLSQILAQDLEETLKRRHIERYQIFLLPAYLLFLVGACLSRGRLSAGGRESKVGSRRSEVRDMSPPRAPLKDISGVATALIILGAAGTFPAAAQTTNAVPLGRSPLAAAATNPAVAVADSGSTNAVPDIPPGRSGARKAQRLYRQGKFAEAAMAYEQAAEGATRDSQRDFMYNAAVAWYQAQDYMKAAHILQQLVGAQRVADAPAAMGLGSALYREADTMDAAVDATTLARREAMLRQSAAAYQEALRAEEADPDSRANLGLVLDSIPEAEEKALVARLMQEHGQAQPFDLLQTMLTAQRDIIATCPSVFTNDSPAQIAQFESLAAQQKANAHLWIPLKGKLLDMLQGQADPDQVAMLNGAMDSIQDSMMDASAALRDLEPGAYGPAVDAESNLYAIWKQLADYTRILQENLRRQSNVVEQTDQTITTGSAASPQSIADQAEASSLTPLFLQRLPDALPRDADKIDAHGPDGPPDPNVVQPQARGLSVAARSNIVTLAEEAIDVQQNALQHLQTDRQVDALDAAMRGYDLLKQIEALLPKSSDQQQEQPEPKNQQQNQQEQEQQNQQQNQQEQQEQEQQNQQEQQEQPAPPPRDISQEELEKLMERALEREEEFKEIQRERNRSAPLAPRERDW